MIYKDKKMGVIDLDSEELPKAKKREITFLRVIAVLIGAYDIFSYFALGTSSGLIFTIIAVLYFILLPKVVKNRYYKTRNKVMEKVAQGEIDLDAMAEKEKQEQAAKEWEQRERRMRCNVCGNVFCYTYSDIKANNRQAGLAALSAVGTIASAVGGTRYDMYEQSKNAERQSGKIKDFSRCPHCNSTDIVEIMPNEAIPLTKDVSQPVFQTSSADELKKYKELLDSGVITQEEFDAKKKQLLGL